VSKTKEGNIARVELVSLNGNSLAPESAEWGVLLGRGCDTA